MKEKLIPLAQHADYTAAAEKLAGYRQRLAVAMAERETLGAEMRLAQARKPETPEQILSAADGAMAGTMPTDLPERINRNEALITALRKAVGVQEIELARIRGERSAAAGQAMRARHIATVGPVLAAMNALADALEAERAVLDELTSLGYNSTLPGMGFVVPQWDYRFDPRDSSDTFWRNWWDERERYAATGLTPAEHDAAKRSAASATHRAATAAKAIARKARSADPSAGELVN